MNQKEKQILKALQSNFPIAKNPYCILAQRVGVTQRYLLSKVKDLKKRGFIRRIGAVVSAKRLGYQSVLVGMRVSRDDVEHAVLAINRSSNVSHNYLRNGEYGLWFTFRAKKKKEINNFISLLRKNKKIKDILVLPAIKTFKINAEFKF